MDRLARYSRLHKYKRDAVGHEHSESDGRFVGASGGGAARSKIGSGSSGDVFTDGERVFKRATAKESAVYEALRGVPGVAQATVEGPELAMPRFKNVVSVDDVPREKRQSLAPVVTKALPHLIEALTALSDAGYDYNDPLQVGFDDKRSPSLFDFSMAAKTTREDAIDNNLSRLGHYLKEFGAHRQAEAIQHAAGVFRAIGDADNELMSDDPEYVDANRLLSQLDGQKPAYLYYSRNGRTIPGIAQTEPRGGIKVLASAKPLDASVMADWEIVPVVHRSTTDQPKQYAKQEASAPMDRLTRYARRLTISTAVQAALAALRPETYAGKKRRASEGQKDLFGGETTSKQGQLRWITIHPNEGKGRPVQIDAEGTIVAGALPKSMHGTKIGDLKKNMEAEKKGETPKKAPAKPKDEPKAAKEPKEGGVEWVRAPAGGATSDVNGQHYKGGQLMPIHGLSEKTEKRPKGKGDGEMPDAPSEDGKERSKREPRRPMSPEMIEAERKEREDKAKWQRLKEGALGKLAGLGDRPGHVFHSGGVKQWNEVAGGFSAEQVDQIAEFARNLVLAHEQKPETWKPGYSSKPYPGDEAIAEMVDEDTARFAQSSVEMFPRVFSKKKLAEVPRFAEAHVRLGEAIEKASFDQLHEIGAMLEAVAKGEAPAEPSAETEPAPEAHPHDSMKDRVRETLATGGAKSLGELQQALHGERHDPRDPLAHPVNRALMELRDAGEIEVQEKVFGEPTFKAKGEAAAPAKAETPAKSHSWAMSADDAVKAWHANKDAIRKSDPSLTEDHAGAIAAARILNSIHSGKAAYRDEIDRRVEAGENIADADDESYMQAGEGHDDVRNALVELSGYRPYELIDEHPEAKKPLVGESAGIAPGNVVEIPPFENRYGFKAKFFRGNSAGMIGLGYDYNDRAQVEMPIASAKHFVNDLSGKVDVPTGSGHEAVDAVASGDAKFVGKGNDGLVFTTNGKAVKVSTTVPYQPFNRGHVTPEEAADRLAKQVEVNNLLASKTSGAQPQELVRHGDKAFAVSDQLEIPDSLTPDQLASVRKSLDEIHAAGYVVGDEIQVGLKSGKPIIYDLGNAQPARDARDVEDDNRRFRSLAERTPTPRSTAEKASQADADSAALAEFVGDAPAPAKTYQTAGEAAAAGRSWGDWSNEISRAFVNEEINDDHPAYQSLLASDIDSLHGARGMMGLHVQPMHSRDALPGIVTGISPDAKSFTITHEDGSTSVHHRDNLDDYAAHLADKVRGQREPSDERIQQLAKLAVEKMGDNPKNIMGALKEHFGLSIGSGDKDVGIKNMRRLVTAAGRILEEKREAAKPKPSEARAAAMEKRLATDAAASSAAPSPAESPAPSPNAPGVDPNGIPLSLGVAAHYGTSHSPESRGAYEQREYVAMLNGDYANLSAMAKTPEQQAILAEEWQRYVDTHTAKRRDYLSARSRVVSPMIAGPSKFPVRQMEKRNNTVDRRRDEMIEHRDKALKAIRRKVTGDDGGPIKTADPKADDKISQAIAERTAMQQKMKDANAVIRRTGVKLVAQGQGNYEVTYPKMPREEVIRQLLEAGVKNEAVASKLLIPDFAGRIGYASYQLTNNNKEIKRLEGRKAEVAKLQSTEASETTHGDITVRENPEAGRIQLEFPGKPDETTRRKLKSLGFRWAPSEGAWQRHLNEAGRQAARQFIASRPQAESPEQYARRLGLDPTSRLARYAMRPQLYKVRATEGQKGMFGAETTSKQPGLRWITIGSKETSEGKRGGIPVQIDGDGTIVGGKRAESLGLHTVHLSDLKEHFAERRAMQSEGKGGSDDFDFGAPSEEEHARQRKEAASTLPGKRSQIRRDLEETAGPDERDQAGLYAALKDVHAELSDQVRDYNEQIDGLYAHLTSKLGHRLSLIQQLRKRSDPSKVEGFDEVLDAAKRHYPALLHDPDGGGDEEYALAEALRNGKKPMPSLDDCWNEAAARWGGKGDYNQSRDEDLDAVPFSMRLARYARRSAWRKSGKIFQSR